MAGTEIKIEGIENIKTKTGIRRIMDKGEEIGRELVTQVTFEGEVDPSDLAQIHRLLKSGHSVNVTISSPQLAMEMAE